MKRQREEVEEEQGALDVLAQCAAHGSRPENKLNALRGVLVGST